MPHLEEKQAVSFLFILFRMSSSLPVQGYSIVVQDVEAWASSHLMGDYLWFPSLFFGVFFVFPLNNILPSWAHEKVNMSKYL